MALRDRLIEESTRLLEPGEQLQEVAWGISVAPWILTFIGWLAWPTDGYRAITWTDRRILLWKGGGVSQSFEGLIQTLDRSTKLGPAAGLLYYRVSAFASPVFITARFFGDLNRADDRIVDPT